MGDGGRKKEKEEEERDDHFKIRAKTRRQEKIIMMKNIVQIHDEQRIIQMTISHRDSHKNCSVKHCGYK